MWLDLPAVFSVAGCFPVVSMLFVFLVLFAYFVFFWFGNICSASEDLFPLQDSRASAGKSVYEHNKEIHISLLFIISQASYHYILQFFSEKGRVYDFPPTQNRQSHQFSWPF